MADKRQAAQVADTIITGGRVIAMHPAISGATAVAVAGGRLVAVGSDAEVRALAGAATEMIDAAGATVMPGIHDGHSHPFAGGLLLTQPTLNYALLDLEQFLKRIGGLLSQTADREPDGWLDVSLWDAIRDGQAADQARPRRAADRGGRSSSSRSTATSRSPTRARLGSPGSTPPPRTRREARSAAAAAASRRAFCSTTRSAWSPVRSRRRPRRRTPTRWPPATR